MTTFLEYKSVKRPEATSATVTYYEWNNSVGVSVAFDNGQVCDWDEYDVSIESVCADILKRRGVVAEVVEI